MSVDRSNTPVKPQVQGEPGAEGHSPVRVRTITRKKIDDVDVRFRSRVIHYRDEGYYIIFVKPSMIAEVELELNGRSFTRLYAYGYLYDVASGLSELQQKLQEAKSITKISAQDSQLIMIPKRVLPKLMEAAAVDPTADVLIVIQAQGKGRQRTYTVADAVSYGKILDEPSDEVLQELEAALERVLSKLGSRKNGGEQV